MTFHETRLHCSIVIAFKALLLLTVVLILHFFSIAAQCL